MRHRRQRGRVEVGDGEGILEGADAFLEKPFDIGELEKIVSRLLLT